LSFLFCDRPAKFSTKYGEYASQTASLLAEKYSQKKLTPTAHKILEHGKDIIELQSFDRKFQAKGSSAYYAGKQGCIFTYARASKRDLLQAIWQDAKIFCS